MRHDQRFFASPLCLEITLFHTLSGLDVWLRVAHHLLRIPRAPLAWPVRFTSPCLWRPLTAIILPVFPILFVDFHTFGLATFVLSLPPAPGTDRCVLLSSSQMENIMLESSEGPLVVKLIDFGLSKVCYLTLHSRRESALACPPSPRRCEVLVSPARSQGRVVLCRTVQCCAVSVLCCAALCCAVLCCAVLCCAVLCCAWLVLALRSGWHDTALFM